MPDNDDAAILREAVTGRPVREIAKSRNMTVPEVHRILDLEAERLFSGEGTRRAMLLEARRLEYLKQSLWTRAMRDGDLTASAIYIKASERLASMLGWNHPQGHVVQITSGLELQETRTSTENLRRVLDELRGEPRAIAGQERPAEPN